ncbi:MAG: hypothetical protein QMC80_01225 [Thermoplasmatales archaeon]|nr:hypothetical protein [Thermoplasmatales archaeon]
MMRTISRKTVISVIVIGVVFVVVSFAGARYLHKCYWDSIPEEKYWEVHKCHIIGDNETLNVEAKDEMIASIPLEGMDGRLVFHVFDVQYSVTGIKCSIDLEVICPSTNETLYRAENVSDEWFNVSYPYPDTRIILCVDNNNSYFSKELTVYAEHHYNETKNNIEEIAEAMDENEWMLELTSSLFTPLFTTGVILMFVGVTYFIFVRHKGMGPVG